MQFLVILSVMTFLATVFPWFAKAANWFILFPIMAVAFGTVTWVFANFFLFDQKFFSVPGWLGFVGFLGVPFGLWITREASS